MKLTLLVLVCALFISSASGDCLECTLYGGYEWCDGFESCVDPDLCEVLTGGIEIGLTTPGQCEVECEQCINSDHFYFYDGDDDADCGCEECYGPLCDGPCLSFEGVDKLNWCNPHFQTSCTNNDLNWCPNVDTPSGGHCQRPGVPCGGDVVPIEDFGDCSTGCEVCEDQGGFWCACSQSECYAELDDGCLGCDWDSCRDCPTCILDGLQFCLDWENDPTGETGYCTDALFCDGVGILVDAVEECGPFPVECDLCIDGGLSWCLDDDICLFDGQECPSGNSVSVDPANCYPDCDSCTSDGNYWCWSQIGDSICSVEPCGPEFVQFQEQCELTLIEDCTTCLEADLLWCIEPESFNHCIDVTNLINGLCENGIIAAEVCPPLPEDCPTCADIPELHWCLADYTCHYDNCDFCPPEGRIENPFFCSCDLCVNNGYYWCPWTEECVVDPQECPMFQGWAFQECPPFDCEYCRDDLDGVSCILPGGNGDGPLTVCLPNIPLPDLLSEDTCDVFNLETEQCELPLECDLCLVGGNVWCLIDNICVVDPIECPSGTHIPPIINGNGSPNGFLIDTANCYTDCGTCTGEGNNWCFSLIVDSVCSSEPCSPEYVQLEALECPPFTCEYCEDILLGQSCIDIEGTSHCINLDLDCAVLGFASEICGLGLPNECGPCLDGGLYWCCDFCSDTPCTDPLCLDPLYGPGWQCLTCEELLSVTGCDPCPGENVHCECTCDDGWTGPDCLDPLLIPLVHCQNGLNVILGFESIATEIISLELFASGPNSFVLDGLDCLEIAVGETWDFIPGYQNEVFHCVLNGDPLGYLLLGQLIDTLDAVPDCCDRNIDCLDCISDLDFDCSWCIDGDGSCVTTGDPGCLESVDLCEIVLPICPVTDDCDECTAAQCLYCQADCSCPEVSIDCPIEASLTSDCIEQQPVDCTGVSTLDILTAIYDSAGGVGWTNPNNKWLSPAPIHTWFGIVTHWKDPTIITEINLPNNNLIGTITPLIGCLGPGFQTLDLSGNSLTGIIPWSIGQLEGLKHLILSDNQLYGQIPQTVDQLEFLMYLYLEENFLGCEVPVEICGMHQLREIHLSDNKLTGEIPACVSTLLYLEEWVSECMTPWGNNLTIDPVVEAALLAKLNRFLIGCPLED